MKSYYIQQKAKQKEFYDSYCEDFDDAELWKISGVENKYRQRFMMRRAALMAKVAGLNSSSVVLEVGCGTGNYTWHWLDSSMSIYGLDLSKGMLRNAARKIDSDKLILIQADAEQLPFKDSCFDAVLSINTLEHLDNILQALTEMKRCCNNGGCIVVSTENDSHMRFIRLRFYKKFVGLFLTDHGFRLPRYGKGLTHQDMTVNDLVSYFGKCEIDLGSLFFMGFIRRELSQIARLHGFMEVIERLLERTPIVKKYAGIMIVQGSVSKRQRQG